MKVPLLRLLVAPHCYIRAICGLLAIVGFISNHTIVCAQNKKESKGTTKETKDLGYTELKVIEIDSVLKIAKETAPFDKSFYIKIKRLSKGAKATPLGNKTRTVKTTSKVQTLNQGTVDEKTREETVTDVFTEEIPGITKATPPAVLMSLELSTINFLKKKKILDEVIQIEPSKPSSDFVYLRVNPLLPERPYTVKVTWKQGDVYTPEEYHFSTVSSSLDKRLTQRLIPQIGVMAGQFKVGKKKYDREVSLLFSVYYHFRPIDPDIPFKSYQPLAWQRWSIMGGVTINSFAKDNVRDDLVGNNNLVLGVGFQPFDALRVSYGAMFFNEIHPNLLLSDSKSIKATSYLALTLDIKLQDLLGGIITTLGLK
ncbi:hypothetical protein [Dyadobacter sp. OTU695]|uniref:hypothetical protein n=1 Tax=Dyadobacter sp. OTU695 TaxID=3043860 RepID=UPI00313D0D05